MKRYVEEMMKKEREKWQLSEVDKAMMTGGDKACAYIEKNADGHLSRLVSRMEWLVFLWLLAGMPVLIVSVIWGINELMAWMNGK